MTMENIVGKIPTKVEQEEDEIRMYFSDGTVAKWLHYQECCEDVVVDDVNGDWADLIGNPLLVADERVNLDDFDEESYESNTWTFYTFRGIGGSVDVKWHGSSNGYYSESVHFELYTVGEQQ